MDNNAWTDYDRSTDWRIYRRAGLFGTYTITGPNSRGRTEVKAVRFTLWGAKWKLRRLRREPVPPPFWELPIAHKEVS